LELLIFKKSLDFAFQIIINKPLRQEKQEKIAEGDKSEAGERTIQSPGR
jgi:hypothetical protein